MFYAAHAGSFDLIPRQGAAIIVWGVLAIGFGLGILPRATLPRAALIPLAGAAALALLTLLSLSWTPSDERTVAELARVLHYGGLVLLVLCVLDRRTWTAAIAGLFAGAAAIVAVALASRLFPDLVGSSRVGEVFDPSRLEYPLGYWNGLGAWCAMVMVMALAWSAHAERLAFRSAALAIVPLALVTEYLTYSRGGAVGVALGAILAIALARHRWTTLIHALVAAGASTIAILAIRSNEQIAEATGGEGGVLVLGVVVAAAIACGLTPYVTGELGIERLKMPSRQARTILKIAGAIALIAIAIVGRPIAGEAWERFSDDTEGMTGASTAARFGSLGSERDEVFESGLDAFSSAPIKGIGPGTFEYWWNLHGSGSKLVDGHSLYVEELAELGLPGLLALLVFLGSLVGLGLLARSRADTDRRAGAAAGALAALGVYLALTGIDWYWELTAISVLALTVGACAVHGLSPPGPRSAPSRKVRIGLTALALLGVAVQVPGYLSTLWIRQSEDAVVAGDFHEGMDLAERASSIAPWATSPYVQRSLVARLDFKLDLAIEEIGEAIEREPLEPRHHLELSRLYELQGRIAAALASARDGQDLDPRSPVVEKFVTELELRAGVEPTVEPAAG